MDHELSLPFGHDFRRREREDGLEKAGRAEWVTDCLRPSVLTVPIFFLQVAESLPTITRTGRACNVEL